MPISIQHKFEMPKKVDSLSGGIVQYILYNKTL